MLSRLLSFFLFFTFGLYAVEGAVSVSMMEKEKYFISEEVVIKIDLKSTAFSIKNSKMGLENSDDYIILEPKSAAFLETIDINGTDWQIVHYEYKLYPLHAGKITLPSFNIIFQASMGYGQPDSNFTFNSEALAFNVEAPKGVDTHTFVLSTTDYSVKSAISMKMKEDNATQIKVGDAITLSIIQKAKNVLDILLKPCYFEESAHFKTYSEEPQLETKEKFAMRIDTYTFVASKEGNVTIPAQEFVWWDAKEEVLHNEKTQIYHFEVLPNPELTLDRGNEVMKSGSKSWKYILVALLLLLILLYNAYPYYEIWSSKRKLTYENSEEGRYKNLLASHDNRALYKNFYLWLEKSSPTLSKEGFRGIVAFQPSFKTSLGQLEEVLVSPEKSFDKTEFINEVKKLRTKLLLEQKQKGLLSSLNP